MTHAVPSAPQPVILPDPPSGAAAKPQSPWPFRGWLAWFGMGAYFSILTILYSSIPPNPDHQIYDFMAFTALDGGAFYVQSGDMNFPGEPALHVVSMLLFGNRVWSYRLLDAWLLIGFCASMAVLLKKRAGSRFALAFVLFYPLVYITAGPWLSGQRDFVATHCVILAMFLYASNPQAIFRRRFQALLLAGLAGFAAVMLKPTFGLVFPLTLGLEMLHRRPWRRVLLDQAIMWGCFAGLTILAFAAAWHAGALAPAREMIVDFSRAQYLSHQDAFLVAGAFLDFMSSSWRWYIPLAGLGAVLLFGSKENRGMLMPLGMTGAIVVVSAFIQQKGFVYHISGLLTVIGMLIAYVLCEAIRVCSQRREFLVRTLVICPVALVVLGMGSKLHSTYADAVPWLAGRISTQAYLGDSKFGWVARSAQYLEGRTEPGQTVWVVNRYPMMASLARRRMPSRLTNIVFLRAGLDSPIVQRWRRETQEIFDRRPPVYVVLMEPFDLEIRPNAQHSDVESVINGAMTHEPAFVIGQELRSKYAFETMVGPFWFFRLKGSKAPDPPVAHEDVTWVLRR